MIAMAQSPTGAALAATLAPLLVAALTVLAVLTTATVLTVLGVVLTSALSRDPVRQSNAATTVDLIAYGVHRRCRPDLDLAPRPSQTRSRSRLNPAEAEPGAG